MINLENSLNGDHESLITNDEMNSRLASNFLVDYATPLGLYKSGGEVFAEDAKHVGGVVKDGLVTVARGAKEGMVETGKAIVNSIEAIGEGVSKAWDWLDL